MKRNQYLLLFITILFVSISRTQESYQIKVLNQNSLYSKISSEKSVFQDLNSLGAYSFTDKKDINLISFMSFWVAYTDSSNKIFLSKVINTKKTFLDYNSGIYTKTFDAKNKLKYALSRKNKIWRISKQQIANHILNYKDTNYIIPEDILTWPANPLLEYGEGNDLAPFIDLNNDGVYSPKNGEYPKIKGDESVYYILSDENSSQDKTGIELHTMVYQYKNQNSMLDSISFVSYKIINRNSFEIKDIRTAVALDANIGNPNDDYIGTDSLRNLLFFYNADNFDESTLNNKGFGSSLITLGLVGLNTNIKSSIYWTSETNQNLSYPTTQSQFFNYMNSKWRFGINLVYGGSGYPGSQGSTSTNANYIFPSDPLKGNGWSAISSGIQGSDISGLYNNQKLTLRAGESKDFEYAIVVAKNKDTLVGSGLSRLYYNVDSVSIFYENSLDIGFPKTSSFDYQIYPKGQVVQIIPQQVNLDTLNPQITRIDGRGNGNNWLEISKQSENEILKNGKCQQITYKINKGPIKVEIMDHSKVSPGYYILNFHNYKLDTVISFTNNENMYVDSAKWTIYRYENEGGEILDSINFVGDIMRDSLLLIDKWSLRILLKQTRYLKYSGNVGFYYPFYVNPITPNDFDRDIVYSDENKKWLGFINDVDVNRNQNWIRSGNNDTDYLFYDLTKPRWKQPKSYSDEFYKSDLNISQSYDPFEKYEKILNGGIAPHFFTSFHSEFMPLSYPAFYKSFFDSRYKSSLSRLLNVDIVFTGDTSLWTHCPVIELSSSLKTNEGGALAGTLRKGLSVDKTGKQIPESTGMGWFPGYAIDIETGQRLHMAFGENSSLVDENGRDMIWNPTSDLSDYLAPNNSGGYDTLPHVAGQHVIYVFGTNVHGHRSDVSKNCPYYDGKNNWVYDKLNSASSTLYYDAYHSLLWVVNPVLNQGHTLLSSDVRLKVRLEKRYNDFKISGVNKGRPSFSWNIEKAKSNSLNESNLDSYGLLIYPNPNNGSFKMIVSDDFVGQQYQLLNTQGNIIKRGVLNSKFEYVDLQSVSGIYFLQIGDKSFKFQIF